jgi:hypothetical protein
MIDTRADWLYIIKDFVMKRRWPSTTASVYFFTKVYDLSVDADRASLRGSVNNMGNPGKLFL